LPALAIDSCTQSGYCHARFHTIDSYTVYSGVIFVLGLINYPLGIVIYEKALGYDICRAKYLTCAGKTYGKPALSSAWNQKQKIRKITKNN